MAQDSKIEWTDATCEVCGSEMPSDNKRFCSRVCYDARPGVLNDLDRNRERINWIQRVWYGPNPDLFSSVDGMRKGRRFEVLAKNKILPKLGFTEVVDLAAISHCSPVDFVGMRQSKRFLIDATSKWQKRVIGKSAFAAALGFGLYVLVISPRDHSRHALIPVDPKAKSVRVPINLIRQMAEQFGESNGRRYKN